MTAAGHLLLDPASECPLDCKVRRRWWSEYRQGESDLITHNGDWFLSATCEVPEEPLNEEPQGFVGVDLGIVEIATTSTGDRHAGRRLNRYRRRQMQLRTKLQKKGTKSAKRVLKRQRRKESRRARDVNHQISKSIVEQAKRTDHGITLEELKGIRGRVRQAKRQRSALHSWSFAQLRDFISYKARRAGVPVVVVDPAYTSQTCSECDHTDRRNRPSRALFVCRDCGVVCTPMSMLHATSPAAVRSRGSRGASQPPPHPPSREWCWTREDRSTTQVGAYPQAHGSSHG